MFYEDTRIFALETKTEIGRYIYIGRFLKDNMKKKTMNIVKDIKQVRTTIPKEFVEELDINNKDKMEWKLHNKKLKGELKKNE